MSKTTLFHVLEKCTPLLFSNVMGIVCTVRQFLFFLLLWTEKYNSMGDSKNAHYHLHTAHIIYTAIPLLDILYTLTDELVGNELSPNLSWLEKLRKKYIYRVNIHQMLIDFPRWRQCRVVVSDSEVKWSVCLCCLDPQSPPTYYYNYNFFCML